MDNNISNEREKMAARIKEARILSGLSQAQAADRMNLQRPAISEIEAGKRKVSAEEIVQFGNLYKVDTSWLLLQEDERNNLRFAARELSKLKEDDIKKLLDILKVLPK